MEEELKLSQEELEAIAAKMLDHGILRYHLDKKGFQETLVLRLFFAEVLRKELKKYESLSSTSGK